MYPIIVNPGFISDDYNELPLLYRSDYIKFVQSEKAKETCKDFLIIIGLSFRFSKV